MCPLSKSASAITPIVFCASFAPWVKATHVPDASWPRRKVRLAAPGEIQTSSQNIASSRANAPAKATAGATIAGIATLCTRPCHWTPSSPDWASAAPTSPPIRAWEELDGRPRRHVIRFQTIAPMRAARMVFSFARPVSMIPFPTVFATAVVTNAPARLATAATRTASRGESARVETEVATAFAVSWNPFVKSKASARPIVTTSSVTGSSVLDEDRFEDVGGVLAGVDRLLELLVDVLPADDRQRVSARAEEVRNRFARQAVSFVLELAQRLELPLRVTEAFEELDRLVQ